MSALISGSLAYDVIMRFPGRFGEHILPERIHSLSVAFMVTELRREFGGCAGNIAYTLNLLGEKAIPVGAAGRDFAPYLEWLDENGIDRHHIRELGDVYTAQAFINTDDDGNQITAFHPGAMGRAEEQTLPVDSGARLGIVAPDGRDAAQQAEFERVEAKPQALEWAFHIAAGSRFRVSADNLSGIPVDREGFSRRVHAQLLRFAEQGFPPRAQCFIDALCGFYGRTWRLPDGALEAA